MEMIKKLLITLLILTTDFTLAFANDSAAELATGGLVLRQSDAIEMESEDLYISPGEIQVRYVFQNRSKAPIKTIVAFPLPDADYGALAEDDSMRIIPVQNDDELLPFSTMIDGQSIKLSTELRAFVGSSEITDRLKKFQLPLLLGLDRNNFLAQVKALPIEARKGLLDDKIIRQDTNDPNFFLPLWRTTITVWREQTFPTGKPVTVEHTYAPIAGGTVGNWREPSLSDTTVPEWYWKAYCIDDGFVSGVMKKIDRARASGKELVTSDLWISYILKSGANWAGPIKKFTLTVDKKSTDTQVSFCGDGVKKISPTKFQLIKSNFIPSENLRVLFVSFSSF